jgi:hypothetical protein
MFLYTYQTPDFQYDFKSLEDDIVYTSRNRGLCASHPGGGAPPKGWSVRPLKWYVSWVQNVVRQFGLYPVEAFEF